MQSSRNYTRRAGLAIAAVGVLLTAAACGGAGDAAGGGSSTYPVGTVIPLSGVNQLYGENYRDAIDLCTDYANKDLGLKGQIKVEHTDGQGLPGPSVTAMNQVVNVNDAVAVLTGFSAPTKALAPIANQRKVPLFNGGASSPDLQGLGDYVFNNIPLADQQIPASVGYVVDKLKGRNWFVLKSTETLGASVLKALQVAVPDAGGKIVGTAEVAADATDFGAQVAAIRGAGPDVVFLATTAGGAIPTIIRQIRDAGIDAQLVGYSGMDIPEVLAEPGAEGFLITSQSIDYDLKQPLTQYFVKAYAKEHPGKQPTGLQANYCSQMSIIGTAIASLEKKGDEVTGENVMKEIRAIGTFDVVGGSVTFQKDGTVSLPIDVRQLKDGAMQVVDTYTPETK
ncbi:MAG: ABC-type branched-chain amino acid transport system, substrate-binding protein [Frankiales bacterium]|nr:ABC-type branched-chain amino acid transport system, substrate-binding protein [Frankiales bacterium]